MADTPAALVMRRADDLGAVTEVPGEITRPYGTRALRQAAEVVEGWMRTSGLETRRDDVGNVIGRRGAQGLPTFVLGSHFDSVKNAGRYDGPLGILVALAALDRVATDRFAIELVAFSEEEGMRFRTSYLGSRGWAGLLTDAQLDVTDPDGTTVREAIVAMGGDPSALLAVRRDGRGLLGYLEVHIEQGPVLEDEDLPVGIVTAISSQSRGYIDVVGKAGHAGNTPPRLRNDALAGAAELVLAVEELMHSTPGLTATVGRLECRPDVVNVIPGESILSYDIRHQDDVVREAALERLHLRAQDIASRRMLTIRFRPIEDHAAVPMSAVLRARLARAIEIEGLRVLELPSGAGHDAVTVAELTSEVAMLFVRCRGGVSHHPEELVTEADVGVSIDVVASFLEQTARSLIDR